MDIVAIAQPVRSRRWAGYVLAILFALLAIGGRALFHDVLHSFPYLLPMLAVTLVASLGGVGPAALVVLLCQLDVQYFVVPPTQSFALAWPTGYIGLIFYVFLSSAIILLMHGDVCRPWRPIG